MEWILKLIPPDRLILVLTEYLAGLLAGTVKNPNSKQAQALFTALEALNVVVARILEKRGQALTEAQTAGLPTFWSAPK